MSAAPATATTAAAAPITTTKSSVAVAPVPNRRSMPPPKSETPEIRALKESYGKRWETEQLALRERLIVDDDLPWHYDTSVPPTILASDKAPKANGGGGGSGSGGGKGKGTQHPGNKAKAEAAAAAEAKAAANSYAGKLKAAAEKEKAATAAATAATAAAAASVAPKPVAAVSAAPATVALAKPAAPSWSSKFGSKAAGSSGTAAATTTTSAPATIAAAAKPIATLAPVVQPQPAPAADAKTATTAAPAPTTPATATATAAAAAANNSKPPLRLIAGVDISFVGEGEDNACAGLVVLEYPSMRVCHELYQMVHLQLPYIPGFLAFREVGFLQQLFARLKRERPELYPQLVFVDGNGRLHPRGFGLACHLGVVTPGGDDAADGKDQKGLVTIGVGKKLFILDGLEKHVVEQQCVQHLQQVGDWHPLTGKSGMTWAGALRTTSAPDSGRRPVYVSTGNRISLRTAMHVTQSCIRFRVPEPIRVADLGSRAVIERWKKLKAAGDPQADAKATATTTTGATKSKKNGGGSGNAGGDNKANGATATATATTASAATGAATAAAPAIVKKSSNVTKGVSYASALSPKATTAAAAASAAPSK